MKTNPTSQPRDPAVAPAGDDDALPDRIGTYRVTGVLGHGGMGRVYRGYHPGLDRQVAIKAIHPSLVADPRTRRRFRREARLMARISHPVVVQVYDLLELPAGDFIVMELAPGRPLRRLTTDGEVLDIPCLLTVSRQVAEGLEAAHRLGIVHRDLKSENVVLAPEGQVKLLDFGLAKSLNLDEEETAPDERPVMGTLRALSPEQAKGLELDGRCDLFALGVLIYELATGRSPFLADSIAETLLRICTLHQEAAHRLRPEMPAALSQLVDHLLQKDAAQRPASAAEVATRLRAIEPEPEPPVASGSRRGVRPAGCDDEHTQREIPRPLPR